MRQKKNLKPNCLKGCPREYVRLDPSNYYVVGLVENYLGVLITDGKINPTGIDLIFKIENINPTEQKDLTKLLILFLSTAINESTKKIEENN
jgi:hypothetical protein